MTHDPLSYTAGWLTNAAASAAGEARPDEMPRPPDPLPITCAPIRRGEEFGPCLLLLQRGEANFPDFAPWEVGAWDGENWWELCSSLIVHPTHWAPLPKVPACVEIDATELLPPACETKGANDDPMSRTAEIDERIRGWLDGELPDSVLTPAERRLFDHLHRK